MRYFKVYANKETNMKLACVIETTQTPDILLWNEDKHFDALTDHPDVPQSWTWVSDKIYEIEKKRAIASVATHNRNTSSESI